MQTRKPRKFFTTGILTLAFGLVLAGPLSAQRLPGDYANTIRPDRLKTPCRPFAADYARGPVKALFFVPFNESAREVVELKERFPMEIGSIIYSGQGKLSADDFWGAPVEGTFTSEKLQVLYKYMEKKWDVFVFGNVPFQGLSPRAQYEILKQVSDGAGLIVVGPEHFPKTFLTNPDLKQGNNVLAGVPFPSLPCYTNLAASAKVTIDQLPSALLKTYPFGKGRIAVLSHVMRYDPQSLSPLVPYTYREQVLYDYYMSVVAKTMLWAAPGKASEIVPVVGGSLSASTVDWANLPEPFLCGTFTIPSGRNLTCKAVVRDLFGNITPLSPPKVEHGSYSLLVTVPELPQGDYFIDYSFNSSKGTEYWGSYGLTVTNAPAAIRDIAVAKPCFQRSDKFQARVTLSYPHSSNLTLRVKGIDDQDREVFQQDIPVQTPNLTLSAELTHCLVMPHHIKAELWQGNRCLDVTRQEFLVMRPEPLFADIIWGQGANTFVGRITSSQLRKAGFEVSLGGGTALEFARVNTFFLPYFDHVEAPKARPSTNTVDWGFYCPEWTQSYITNTQAKVRAFTGLFPYYYSLGDENGYSYARGKNVAPSEVKEWHKLLRDTYANQLDLLNKEWATTYASFDDIEIPNVAAKMTMADIPRKHLWMHYCEKLYADSHHIIANAIRTVDPKARVGAEGSGGGDMELTLDGLQMWGPYPSRGDNAMMRSFGQPDLLRGNWWGGYVSSRRAKADGYWDQVLSGGVDSDFYYCTVGWEGNFSTDLSWADFFEQDQLPTIKEIASSVGPLLNRTPVAKMGVGIFYSMPSDHALTIDARFGPPSSSRDGLLKFFEDNGLSSYFYSEKQLLAGKLDKDHVRVLFLPQTLCMSDAAAEALKKWVTAGGTLVADMQVGLRNERGAARTQGVLDSLFGVHQDLLGEPITTNCTGEIAGVPVQWDRIVVDGKVTTANSATNSASILLGGKIPVAIGNHTGKGHTLFMNLSLGKILANYGNDAQTRAAMSAILDQGGVFTKLQAPAGYLVTRFQGNGYELLSCRITAEGKDGATVVLGKPYAVYDVRARKYLGVISELTPSNCSGKKNLFTLLPAPAADFVVDFPKLIEPGALAQATVSCQLSTASENDGRSYSYPERLYRVRVYAPDGAEIDSMRTFATGAEKPFTITLPFAFNQANGKYSVEVVDILTGAAKTISFEIKGARS